MYLPPHFAETDRDALHDLIERYSFGLLVSQVDGTPFATHLPFLLDRDAGRSRSDDLLMRGVRVPRTVRSR